ncbi:esterase-like protein [Ramlibacter tataouinensis TTB310]|uniref:Esterase-like protein n=1 Tax=Ramlibacter tataouinensis (strain ATCC BAA-407 / DSM 14655 / LMG 21543 / TTB310) TaxID=365046 RepID=F5XW44_RAMTT|nr:esterase-like protein [Ramlibacter tataouinensis TTB310]
MLLQARPRATAARLAPGLYRIDTAAGAGPDHRPAWLRMPAGQDGRAPSALAVMLHGSGGEPEQGLALLEPYASRAGLPVLAPASDSYTWDAVLGRAGPDAAHIDEALGWVFQRHAFDAARIHVGGFSDGASCALALGLGNGGLFRRVLALSPGFVPPTAPQGEPEVLVSHGTADRVLPIARCSRVIVPSLRRAGYAVDYREFDGGHEIPAGIAEAAVQWLLR